MRSLHEAFETVLQFLEVAAGEPVRLSSPLALAAVRTLGRCVFLTQNPPPCNPLTNIEHAATLFQCSILRRNPNRCSNQRTASIAPSEHCHTLEVISCFASI